MKRFGLVLFSSVLVLALNGCGRGNNTLNQATTTNPYALQQRQQMLQGNQGAMGQMPQRIYPVMPTGARQSAQTGDRAIATPNGYVYSSTPTSQYSQQYNCASPALQQRGSMSQGMQNPCNGSGAAPQQTPYGTNPQTQYPTNTNTTTPYGNNAQYGNTTQYGNNPQYGNTTQYGATPQYGNTQQTGNSNAYQSYNRSNTQQKRKY